MKGRAITKIIFLILFLFIFSLSSFAVADDGFGELNSACVARDPLDVGKISGTIGIISFIQDVEGYNLTEAIAFYPIGTKVFNSSTSSDILLANESRTYYAIDFETELLSGRNTILINVSYTNATDPTKKAYRCETLETIAAEHSIVLLLQLIFSVMIAFAALMLINNLIKRKNFSLQIFIGVLISLFIIIAVVNAGLSYLFT